MLDLDMGMYIIEVNENHIVAPPKKALRAIQMAISRGTSNILFPIKPRQGQISDIHHKRFDYDYLTCRNACMLINKA